MQSTDKMVTFSISFTHISPNLTEDSEKVASICNLELGIWVQQSNVKGIL